MWTIVSRPVLKVYVDHRFSSCSESLCGPSFLIVCWKFMWSIVSHRVLKVYVDHRFSSCAESLCAPSFLIMFQMFMWTIAYRPVLNFYVEKMPGWDKPKSQMTLGHDKNRNRYISHCIPKCLKMLKIGLMHQCASWVSLTHQTMLSLFNQLFFFFYFKVWSFHLRLSGRTILGKK